MLFNIRYFWKVSNSVQRLNDYHVSWGFKVKDTLNEEISFNPSITQQSSKKI
jgi:hypothetical protein